MIETASHFRPDLLLPASAARLLPARSGENRYGENVAEAAYLANARVLAERSPPFGDDIAMIDAPWRGACERSSAWRAFAPLQLDAHGRPQPAADRFPSALDGCGFAPLAAQIHRLGLRLGLHIVRGVPRQAVALALPIAGSTWHCHDVIDPAAACAFDTDMCAVDPDHPGAFDWYRAWFAQLAACGVDVVRIDGTPSGHGSDVRELELIRRAMHAAGRAMELMLSPG